MSWHGRYEGRSIGRVFPKTFAKLPVDPFTGKPFVYRRTKTGCKLWSLDDDCKDDGGVGRMPGTRRRKTYDVVFELKK